MSNNVGVSGTTSVGSPTLITSTGAPTTTVLGTTALGDETITGTSLLEASSSGLTISLEDVAIVGTSVVTLTGVSATSSVGAENVYGLIEPDQLANWIERVA